VEFIVVRRVVGERIAQRALAFVGKLKKIVVIEAEQRALQRHRQRQIVLR